VIVMAGLLNSSSVLVCPHGGTVSVVTSNTRVNAGGGAVVRAGDSFLVAGCPFILGLVPHPCVEVQWVVPASRSQALGDFTLTEDSIGLCTAADQAVQGTVQIVFTQPQVTGQ
jgi:hypothetical protein